MSQVGYSSWDHKGSDMTEQLSTSNEIGKLQLYHYCKLHLYKLGQNDSDNMHLKEHRSDVQVLSAKKWMEKLGAKERHRKFGN